MFLINSIWMPILKTDWKLEFIYIKSKNGCSDRPLLKELDLVNGKLPVTMCIQYRMIWVCLLKNYIKNQELDTVTARRKINTRMRENRNIKQKIKAFHYIQQIFHIKNICSLCTIIKHITFYIFISTYADIVIQVD